MSGLNKQLKNLLDKIFANEIICVHTKLRYQKHYNSKQNITQKTKDRATPLKQGVYSCAPEGLAVPSSRVTPVVLLLNDTNIRSVMILVNLFRILQKANFQMRFSSIIQRHQA